MSVVEVPVASVCDAGQVALAALGAEVLRREALGLPTHAAAYAAAHLRRGLEDAAARPVGAAQDAVVGYLVETYGLLAVGRDPLRRPLLPPVPATGAEVRRRVLAVGGRALRLNTGLLAVGATLLPAIPPTTP